MLRRTSIEPTRIADIHVLGERRPVDAAVVDRLAESMARIGLQVPVAIRVVEEMVVNGVSTLGAPILIAGAHRLAAARKLGWDSIETVILEAGDDADDYERWEIAENLHRAELTVEQRAAQIARWVELAEKETGGATCAGSLRDGRKSGPQHQPRGINAAVRDLGIDRTEAQRAVKIAAIAPEAKEAARAAGLDDNQSALLRVAKAAPAQQVATVHHIAALYVQTGGCYFGLPEVDPWDEARDARRYAGPHPVVAHPPCGRWGRYCGGSPTTWPRLTLGDDGGCFEAALAAVRQWGGVLEHPEGSHAWRHFELNIPPHDGGWIAADWQGGWTCCVEQGHYGHRARKKTWLYATGFLPPALIWGKSAATARLDDGFHSAEERRRAVKTGVCQRLSKRERAATPIPFRDLLLALARTAAPACRRAA